jgi:hypothetical protein
MAARVSGLGLIVGLASCGGGPGVRAALLAEGALPTAPVLLSPSSPKEDEDPSVLRAADGTLWVAFFSRRAGNADLYLTSTRDGVTFTPATRITHDADADFYPQLHQDDAGVLHLVWFRRQEHPPFFAHVRHARSQDGAVWTSGGDGTAVAAAPADGSGIEDWVPTLTSLQGGPLRVYFVSRLRAPPRYKLFTASSGDGGDTWSAPAYVPGINDDARHDHLPFAQRTGDHVSVVWVRHDDSNPTPWLNPSADIWFATSVDGLRFTTPVNVTHDMSTVDVFPAVTVGLGGAPFLLWVSGGPVVALPVAQIAGYPAARIELAIPGYSPRMAAVPGRGAYLAAWVQGPDGQQDVFARLLAGP